MEACKRAGQRATGPRDQGTKGPKDQRTKGPKTKQEAFVARQGILEACKRAERAQEAEPQWAWRLRKRTGKRACKRARQRTITGPREPPQLGCYYFSLASHNRQNPTVIPSFC